MKILKLKFIDKKNLLIKILFQENIIKMRVKGGVSPWHTKDISYDQDQ